MRLGNETTARDNRVKHRIVLAQGKQRRRIGLQASFNVRCMFSLRSSLWCTGEVEWFV